MEKDTRQFKQGFRRNLNCFIGGSNVAGFQPPEKELP